MSALVRTFGPAADVVGITNPSGVTSDVHATTAPEPGRGDVVVRMITCAINPSDILTIAGAYPSRTPLPYVPGFEGVGRVAAVGPDVTEITVGSRVLPIGTAGSWSTHKLTPARWCFPVAPHLDDDQAATSYINPVTAWLMVHGDVPVPPGTGVIVDAAASQIGRMLIRMLNHRGIAPIAVVRSPSSAQSLHEAPLHLRDVLVTSAPDFAERLAATTRAAPPDLLLDAVGGEIAGVLARALRPAARVVHYGLLSGEPLPAWLHHPDSGPHVELFRLRDWIHTAPRPTVAAALAAAQDLVAAGIAQSTIDSRFPLTDITAALHRHAAPDRRGKVLLDLA